VVAANIDTVFVVQGLDDNFNLRRLERCLVMVHEGGAEPVVLLNKSDLLRDATAATLEAALVAGETPVVRLSAMTGDGLDQLGRWMRPGRTVAFIGSSGVGKSTLINRLFGEELQETNEVRERDSKGRHTTVRREMFHLGPHGIVIDTPGMREFHLWFAGEGLDAAFADIEQLASQCRFNDCTHGNEPECAVLAAVADGRLTAERLGNFRRLQEDLERLNRRYQRRLWRDKAAGSFTPARAPRPHKRGGR
jgi:ribosome biogenesis GTPase